MRISDWSSDVCSSDLQDWHRCFAIDLDGAWYGCKAVLPQMLDQGGGSIINIASTHSSHIIPGCFPYPVAKHGLLGLTRSLGIEYAPNGMRVNEIGRAHGGNSSH